MSRTKTPILGKGIYGLGEAARLSGLHEGRVRSWFMPRSDRKSGPVLRRDYKGLDVPSISFLDLVELNVIGKLRDAGVSMNAIRKAYQSLRDTWSPFHPFARSDLYTDGRQVFLAVTERTDCRLQEVVSGQQFFEDIREVLTNVVFGMETKLAERWNIYEGVVIDPKISLGKPTIEHTNVTTWVVAQAFRANNRDIELVADLYRLSITDVSRAVEFEERHGRRSAA